MAAWLPSGAAGWHRAQALSTYQAGSTAGRRSSTRTALADPRMARSQERHRHSCSVTSSHSVCPWPGGQPAAAGEHGWGYPKKPCGLRLMPWRPTCCPDTVWDAGSRAPQEPAVLTGMSWDAGATSTAWVAAGIPSPCAQPSAQQLHCTAPSCHTGNRQSHTSLGLVPILVPAVCSWCQLTADMSSQLVSALLQRSPRLAAHGTALGVLSLCQALQPWVLRVL